MTTLGKRSEFTVSADERVAELEINRRLSSGTVMLFSRQEPEPTYFLVLSCGSRRHTMQQAYPFVDVDGIVETLEPMVRRWTSPAARPARYVDDPDEADEGPWAA